MPALRYLGYIAATCGLLGLVHILLFVYQLGSPVAAEYWLYETEVVKRYFVQQINGPKVVILGGSSALFGIDASMMEKALGVPTINMSLHAGLAIDYMLDEAKPFLRPGDTVLLCLEYERYSLTSPYDQWFLEQVMTWNVEYFWRLNILEKSNFLKAVPLQRIVAGAVLKLLDTDARARQKRPLKSDDKVVAEYLHGNKARRLQYSVANMDANGDMVWTQGSFHGTPDYGLTDKFTYSSYFWETLKIFREYGVHHNIALYVIWPATVRSPVFILAQLELLSIWNKS